HLYPFLFLRPSKLWRRAGDEGQTREVGFFVRGDMKLMLQQLEKLYQDALGEVDKIVEAEALRGWETKYIGRKGEVTTLVRSVGQLPKEERAEFGKRANEIKNELTEAFTKREELIKQRELAQSLEEGGIDVTLPGRPTPV